MAFTVETGAIVAGANSFESVAELEAYWADRGGLAFGTRASGTVYLRTLPSDGDTLQLGSVTYRFKTALAAANDVLIGSAVADSQANLVAAVAGLDGAGTTFHAGTLPNPDVTLGAFSGGAATVTAGSYGSAGDSIALAESMAGDGNAVSGATLSGATADLQRRLVQSTEYVAAKFRRSFVGYQLTDSQSLPWPRGSAATQPDGYPIATTEIPQPLKDAISVLSSKDTTALLQDTAKGAAVGAVQSISEQVGPLKTSTTYAADADTVEQTEFALAESILRPILRPGHGSDFAVVSAFGGPVTPRVL